MFFLHNEVPHNMICASRGCGAFLKIGVEDRGQGLRGTSPEGA